MTAGEEGTLQLDVEGPWATIASWTMSLQASGRTISSKQGAFSAQFLVELLQPLEVTVGQCQVSALGAKGAGRGAADPARRADDEDGLSDQASVPVTIVSLEFDDRIAAIDDDHGARNVAHIVPGQEPHRGCHLIRPAGPSNRRGFAGDDLRLRGGRRLDPTGEQALQVMPLFAVSMAIARVRPVIAAFPVEYPAERGLVTSGPVTEAMLMILPCFLRRMKGMAARLKLKAVVTLRSRWRRHSASETLSIIELFERSSVWIMPALLTRISSLPKRLTTSLTS